MVNVDPSCPHKYVRTRIFDTLLQLLSPAMLPPSRRGSFKWTDDELLWVVAIFNLRLTRLELYRLESQS